MIITHLLTNNHPLSENLLTEEKMSDNDSGCISSSGSVTGEGNETRSSGKYGIDSDENANGENNPCPQIINEKMEYDTDEEYDDSFHCIESTFEDDVINNEFTSNNQEYEKDFDENQPISKRPRIFNSNDEDDLDNDECDREIAEITQPQSETYGKQFLRKIREIKYQRKFNEIPLDTNLSSSDDDQHSSDDEDKIDIHEYSNSDSDNDSNSSILSISSDDSFNSESSVDEEYKEFAEYIPVKILAYDPTKKKKKSSPRSEKSQDTSVRYESNILLKYYGGLSKRFPNRVFNTPGRHNFEMKKLNEGEDDGKTSENEDDSVEAAFSDVSDIDDNDDTENESEHYADVAMDSENHNCENYEKVIEKDDDVESNDDNDETEEDSDEQSNWKNKKKIHKYVPLVYDSDSSIVSSVHDSELSSVYSEEEEELTDIIQHKKIIAEYSINRIKHPESCIQEIESLLLEFNGSEIERQNLITTMSKEAHRYHRTSMIEALDRFFLE